MARVVQVKEVGPAMRAFLAAVAICLVIAIAASFVLDAYQQNADIANTTKGARIDPRH
jgi:hypothetical protein